jgi:hypothetical protein
MFLTSRPRPSALRLSLTLLFALTLIQASSAWQAARAQTSGYITDRGVYPEPPLAEPAAAGQTYRDPVFGTPIMRATDPSDCPAPGCGTWYSNWPTFNSDDTRLLIRKGESGDMMIRAFDPVNFALGAVLRVNPTVGGTIPNWQGATWSRTDPDLLYVVGAYYDAGYAASGLKLYAYRPSTDTFTLVKDFAPQLSPGNPDYFEEMHVDAHDDLFVLSQKRVGAGSLPIAFIVWRKSTDQVLLNIPRDSWLDSRKGTPDKSGRWVLFPLNDHTTQADGASHRVWDSQTNTWQAIHWTASDDSATHGDMGTAMVVGRGNFSGGDNIRSLGNVQSPSILFDFKDANGVTDWSYDLHTTLYADDESWVTVGLFFDPTIGLPSTGAFRDEVMQIATDGSQRIRRLLHHRSHIDNQTDTTGYWAMPKPTISRDGRFIAYTSNWDASGRYDLFIAKIDPPSADPSSTPTPTPTPKPSPSPTPTPSPVTKPSPTPTPTPTPTPARATGRAQDSLAKARRDAQDISNQLGVPSVTPPGVGAATTDPASKISSVAAEIQQTYSDFSFERALYPAAPKIESALTKALNFTNLAGTYASQSQTASVKSSLERAIDYLEWADVLMLYGDVSNPVDYAQFMVRQHYVDFLGREPDEAGRAFWTDQITQCGADSACVASARINVSAAYFLSIEFQQTGYLVYRLYRASYGRTVQFQEFLDDMQEVEKGLVVGQTGWQDVLAANKKAFLQEWVQREDFRARYGSLTPEQFVDLLFSTMGVTPAPAERDSLVASLESGASRADVLGTVVEGDEFSRRESDPAFVLMQYFGYLRRDPDQAGYDFWLKKLEDSGGDYRRAEMVKAFLSSDEYRSRFTQW